MVYIAGSRFVKEENIEQKIPGLYGKLKDDNNIEYAFPSPDHPWELQYGSTHSH